MTWVHGPRSTLGLPTFEEGETPMERDERASSWQTHGLSRCEITKGLRKSVPAKYVATRSVDRPEARMTSKRTMAVETNNMMCAMKTREQEL